MLPLLPLALIAAGIYFLAKGNEDDGNSQHGHRGGDRSDPGKRRSDDSRDHRPRRVGNIPTNVRVEPGTLVNDDRGGPGHAGGDKPQRTEGNPGPQSVGDGDAVDTDDPHDGGSDGRDASGPEHAGG